MRVIHTKFIKVVSGILFSGFLISLPTHAQEVDLIAEIEPILQVIVPASVSLNLTPNLDGSPPVFVSKDLEILVATNNPTGYHLSLQTNSTNLTNNQKDKDGNYPILETISSELSEENFTTNRWGYKYNTENYLPLTTNINLNSTTTPTNRDEITLTFGAKADITKPAGTYSLALNFTAVTNIIPGVLTINYDGNGATSGSITKQQIEMGTSRELANNENGFSREDYVFLNWNTSPDGNGTSYSENELYATTLTAKNKSLTLYAIWAPPMQTFTLADCKAKATEELYIVNDVRDRNIYTVRYIADNCWMTRNLRLANGVMVAPDNSNVVEEYIVPTTELEGNDYAWTSGQVTCSLDSNVGCYYNFVAASAGTITGASTDLDSEYDICPKGWRIPNYSQILGLVEGGSGYASIFSPTLGGTYYAGVLYLNGGVYWSSTRNNEDSSSTRYDLGVRDDGSLFVGGNGVAAGMNVRCVRKN